MEVCNVLLISGIHSFEKHPDEAVLILDRAYREGGRALDGGDVRAWDKEVVKTEEEEEEQAARRKVVMQSHEICGQEGSQILNHVLFSWHADVCV